ncbi:MAG: class I SAM-dependent methyltransferase [Pseudomonadota bacterium]
MSDLDALFTLHSGLLREAPGSDATTLRALEATGLSGAISVADMGCGPGAASLMLAQALPGAQITAIDLHQPYLDALEARAQAAGVAGQITTSASDMAHPPLAAASQDLIWCEGALYFLGVTEGLSTWKPLLKPGGRVVFSEVVWLTDEPPKDAALMWMEYPAMTTRAGVLDRISAAGFSCLHDFQQPDSDWREYLGPLGARAAALRPEADEALRAVLDGAEQEASLFERHGDAYGYQMFITEPA